jgi:hypothetical protein
MSGSYDGNDAPPRAPRWAIEGSHTELEDSILDRIDNEREADKQALFKHVVEDRRKRWQKFVVLIPGVASIEVEANSVREARARVARMRGVLRLPNGTDVQ